MRKRRSWTQPHVYMFIQTSCKYILYSSLKFNSLYLWSPCITETISEMIVPIAELHL